MYPGKILTLILLLSFIICKNTKGQNSAFDSDSYQYPNFQTTKDSSKVIHPYNRTRVDWLIAGNIVAYAGTLTGLSVMWYSGYPRSSFHFYNDDEEWMKVDKLGHMYSAYLISNTSYELWQWAGLSRKKSIWIGGLSGLAYQSIIEILDGFSAEYGFSPGDYTANVLGSAIFISQQLAWDEQKIRVKFSTSTRRYPEPDLEARANKIYGDSWADRTLKDYNKQTYWLSANVNSLFNAKTWPAWLNIAVGYGADGMFGAYSNIGKDKAGNIIFDRTDIRRYRQWYLSPDLDLTKIKTSKKGLRTILFILNSFKFPAPALEFSKGKFKGHWLFF